jgi:hypothetical protein
MYQMFIWLNYLPLDHLMNLITRYRSLHLRHLTFIRHVWFGAQA